LRLTQLFPFVMAGLDPAIHVFGTRPGMTKPSRAASATGLISLPRLKRAWGMPGAQCTHSLAWKRKKPHELVTAGSTGSPGIPAREWF
jgi:hypothetical protein